MRYTLSQYREIIGEDKAQEIEELASRVAGRRVIMINATARGGGVAELLESLIPLMQSLGINAEWRVLEAPQSFFEATKTFHNGLQGDMDGSMQETIQTYNSFYDNDVETYNEELVSLLKNLSDDDIVVVHDPQPLGLIKYRRKGRWIWRCHIDIQEPNQELYDFVQGMTSRFDKLIVSRDIYMHESPHRYVIIPPSINPISPKNKEADADTILGEHGIPTDKGLITQVSRLDKWKDPVGVIDAYTRFREEVDGYRLALVYTTSVDDPEGAIMYKKVADAIQDNPYKDDIHMIVGDDPLLVNALQRKSDVVLQKSLREGFALTVSEALWKGTPVIGGNVGGIPLQVVNGKNGYSVNSYEIDSQGNPHDDTERERHINDTAKYLKEVINSEGMGEYGVEHVREHFLVTRHLRDYLHLFSS